MFSGLKAMKLIRSSHLWNCLHPLINKTEFLKPLNTEYYFSIGCLTFQK